MATVLFIGALAYFSASLLIALMAGRFISLQDENIENIDHGAFEPDQQHWREEMPVGQAEAGAFQYLLSYREGDRSPVAMGTDIPVGSQAPLLMEEKPDADT